MIQLVKRSGRMVPVKTKIETPIIASKMVQVKAATADAVLVVAKAKPANGVAPNARSPH